MHTEKRKDSNVLTVIRDLQLMRIWQDTFVVSQGNLNTYLQNAVLDMTAKQNSRNIKEHIRTLRVAINAIFVLKLLALKQICTVTKKSYKVSIWIYNMSNWFCQPIFLSFFSALTELKWYYWQVKPLSEYWQINSNFISFLTVVTSSNKIHEALHEKKCTPVLRSVWSGPSLFIVNLPVSVLFRTTTNALIIMCEAGLGLCH